MNNLFITYYNNHPVLQWDPYKDTTKYVIYRGLTETELIKLAETTYLQYSDDSDEADLFQKMDRVTYYYQIRSVNSTGIETIITDARNYELSEIEFPIRGVLNEIIRRNVLSLNRILWDSVDVYLKKGAGERCNCYDPYRKDSDTNFVCEICYGTTYKGGFDKIPSRVKLRNGPVKVTEFSFGHKVDATKEAWTITYPVMNSGDFFRTKKGEIYEVDGIKRKEEGGILLQQLMSLKLIPTTDPYYQIFK